MVFSSIIFCTIFLPVCLAGYFTIPRLLKFQGISKLRLQNYILLFFSIVFYAFGGIKYLFLIGAIILINWGGGLLVGSAAMSTRKKWLIATIALDLCTLFFFKYFNLFIALIEQIFFPKIHNLGAIMSGIFSGTGNGALGIEAIVLPVGISFYTFQALSYVVDVYRNEVKLQYSFANFALYIVCFPQLIAGPIVHYKDIERALSKRQCSAELFSEGIRRFCFGLSKKVLIANSLGFVVDNIYAENILKLDATTAWIGSLFYSFQIYYDFSGYSDMAIGLGKMFGFEFKENFNFPYQAHSIQDFWRRWHISLSTWFKNYVYISLGGNRRGLKITCRNVLIVFLLTGIWHGANWTFFLWGLIYGIFLVIERLGFGKLLERNPIKFANRIFVFLIVNFLWVLFRSDDIHSAFLFIGRMFTGGIDLRVLLRFLSFGSIIAFVLAILFSGFLQTKLKLFNNKKVMSVCAIILYVVSLVFMVNGTYNPFIYFQF